MGFFFLVEALRMGAAETSGSTTGFVLFSQVELFGLSEVTYGQ